MFGWFSNQYWLFSYFKVEKFCKSWWFDWFLSKFGWCKVWLQNIFILQIVGYGIFCLFYGLLLQFVPTVPTIFRKLDQILEYF